MKIFYDFNKKLDDDVKEALRLLETDGSKRREYFHILTGFDSLYAISVPGTRFKVRAILKYHGHNVYEYVFTDNGHKYPAAFLKNLDKLEFREGLKPLFGDIDNDSGSSTATASGSATIPSNTKPAYYLRGRIVIPTDEQFDLTNHVADFVKGDLKDRKFTAIEGVPGAGKTLSIEVALENLVRQNIRWWSQNTFLCCTRDK